MSIKQYSLSTLLIALLAGTSVCDAGESHLFEFMDDFHKPCRCQRDPFEERIETERHDFTQSATTVGRGVVQIESGYSYFYKEEHGESESSHTLPELMMRVGLSEDIEFRIRWNYVWQFIDEEEEEDREGSEDLRYSFKLQLTRPECPGFCPTSALEVRGSAPTGGDEFTNFDPQFSLDYIYQWQLAEFITFAGSTGWGTKGFGDFALVPRVNRRDYFNAFSQSAVFGFELTENNALYTEWFGIISDGLDGGDRSVSYFNVGIDHYFSDDFVFDVRLGFGTNDDSDDFFAGIGGGYRF